MTIKCLLAAIGMFCCSAAFGQIGNDAPAPPPPPPPPAQLNQTTTAETSSESAKEKTPAGTEETFCNVLLQLLEDAPGGFPKFRGNGGKKTSYTSEFSATRTLPGASQCSIIEIFNWSYDAVMFTGASRSEMGRAYGNCRKELEACLVANGYEVIRDKNGDSKVSAYDDIRLAKPNKKTGSELPTAEDITVGGGPYAVLNVTYDGQEQMYKLKVSVKSR